MHSNTPALVLEGVFDPITPPAYGQLAAQTLTHSFYVEFPDIGHAVGFHNTCARQIVLGFLEQPETTPDGGCVAGLRVAFVGTGDTEGGGQSAGGSGFTLTAEMMYEVVAPVLHLTPADVQSRVQEGLSVADVAQAQHVPIQQVKDALLAEIKKELNAEVQKGSLSQADADIIFTKVSGGIDDVLNRRGGP